MNFVHTIFFRIAITTTLLSLVSISTASAQGGLVLSQVYGPLTSGPRLKINYKEPGNYLSTMIAMIVMSKYYNNQNVYGGETVNFLSGVENLFTRAWSKAYVENKDFVILSGKPLYLTEDSKKKQLLVYNNKETVLPYTYAGGLSLINNKITYTAIEDAAPGSTSTGQVDYGGIKSFVVYNGKEYGKEYDFSFLPFVFNGQFSYYAVNKGKLYLVVNGIKYGNGYIDISYPFMSHGKVAFLAKKETQKYVFVVDNQEVAEFDDFRLYPDWQTKNLIFSFVQNGINHYYLNGEEFQNKDYDSIDIVFMVDNTLTYVATKGSKKYLVQNNLKRELPDMFVFRVGHIGDSGLEEGLLIAGVKQDKTYVIIYDSSIKIDLFATSTNFKPVTELPTNYRSGSVTSETPDYSLFKDPYEKIQNDLKEKYKLYLINPLLIRPQNNYLDTKYVKYDNNAVFKIAGKPLFLGIGKNSLGRISKYYIFYDSKKVGEYDIDTIETDKKNYVIVNNKLYFFGKKKDTWYLFTQS